MKLATNHIVLPWPMYTEPRAKKVRLGTNIAIACHPTCEIINNEINLILLVKSFFLMSKEAKQKFKYIENENSF